LRSSGDGNPSRSAMSGPNILLVGNGRPHHVGACFQRALRGLDHPYRFVDEATLTPEPPGAWIRRSVGRVPGVVSLARRVFVRTVMATAFRSDVAFIGGGDEERASVFAKLAGRNHADLRLYGGYWKRYPSLRPFARGFVFGRQLRLVLGGTRVAPCLVRRANRDSHVM